MHAFVLWLLPLVLVTLVGGEGRAAVKKFHLNTITINEAPQASPNVEKFGADGPPGVPFDTAFVDDSSPPSPVLKKFRFKIGGTVTVLVPGLAGDGAFIFLSNNYLEGPGPVIKPSSFTGTGHTAAGSTIAWGIVTGWTVTGGQFCNSSPPLLCEFAELSDETTLDPQFRSDFYDLGTWFMHPTGFTAIPFVHQYGTQHFGNAQRWVRGFFVIDATVPALPLVGVLVLGGSLAFGAVTALRGRRR